MNEQIKKLAEQCWDIRLDGRHFDLEQFAELIVQECSRMADGWVDNDDNGKNYPSEMIKKHFGVEEYN
jgi:hypothetical protein